MRYVLALLMLAASAQAVLAGVDGCEKIKDADAYNSCLASFGPAAGSHNATRAPPGEEGASAQTKGHHEAAKSARPPRKAEEPQPSRKANGRVRIEIFR